MIVEILNYTKKIKTTVVLDNISLELSGGKIYGLQGINGSGKTMLLRAICGLIYPTSGKVLIDEKELGKDISFPESVGALIENPVFLKNMTGFDNLALLCRIKRIASKTDIIESLDRVGLDPNDKRVFRKYSLGMRQRLGIASSIVEKPDIILLDEPFNALDKSGVEMASRIIKEEKKRGALVVLACHSEELLSDLADEIIVLEGGKISGKKVREQNEDH